MCWMFSGSMYSCWMLMWSYYWNNSCAATSSFFSLPCSSLPVLRGLRSLLLNQNCIEQRNGHRYECSFQDCLRGFSVESVWISLLCFHLLHPMSRCDHFLQTKRLVTVSAFIYFTDKAIQSTASKMEIDLAKAYVFSTFSSFAVKIALISAHSTIWTYK